MLMFIRPLAIALALFSLNSHAEESPRVVVSIAPIHSLVAGVMEGIAVPRLLVQPNADPHTYALKPSQMSALQHADLVIWVGETVESYLPKTLFTLGKGPKVITLTALPGMKLLPSRKGGMWEAHEEEHEHGHVEHGDIDGHVWLDIENAKTIVNAALAALSELDPQRAAQYQRNGRRMVQALEALDRDIREMVAPVAAQPYLVFHDAYHYFDAYYQLNAVGAISVDPERRPGARRLSEIRREIEERRIVCVFSQPQFPEDTVQMLIEGTAARHSRRDDLGSGLQTGPELYFNLMRKLAENMRQCLQG